jgi:hypothetical protein
MTGSAMSNRVADGKTPDFALKSALSEVTTRPRCSNGGPARSIHRTWEALIGVFMGLTATSFDVAA